MYQPKDIDWLGGYKNKTNICFLHKKPSPRKRKAKWLSDEDLQIAEKRKGTKSKGEKERCTHLNAEFQTTARRDDKAFPRDQWKIIEDKNRIGKTRDLFKKIKDTKGIFHEKWTQ